MDETQDYGIRYFGIPSGYEFASLLGTIEMVPTGKLQLSMGALPEQLYIDEVLKATEQELIEFNEKNGLKNEIVCI